MSNQAEATAETGQRLEGRKPQTVEWLNEYIFWSFYYSQGKVDIQTETDRFALATSSVDISQGGESICKRISTYIKKGQHPIQTTPPFPTMDQISEEVNGRFHSIENIEAQRRAGLHITTSVALILNHMIDAEELKMGIIVNPKRVAIRTLEEHPRFGRSIVLAHLVDGRHAHHEVFNRFFDEARLVVASGEDTTFIPRLDRIACQESHLRGTEPRDVAAYFTSLTIS